MARYKPQECNSLLLPVVLSEQIIPGSFAFALNSLVDHELVMLKIALLAYSQGLISSRMIERPVRAISSSSLSAAIASPAMHISPSLWPSYVSRSSPWSANSC